MIDSGQGERSWIEAVKKVLAQEAAVISQCLLTHWHHDHVGGVEHLREVFPDVQVFKNEPTIGQLAIEDGQKFEVEGATLRSLHCPGHTTDHMALILDEEDAMFTGDNVLGQGTAVFEDLSSYMSSLDKMRELFSGKAYPGHGPVIDDGRARITEYIHHRQQREDQVLQVLRSPQTTSGGDASIGSSTDPWTVMEIVKIIYKDVPENLHLPASGGIVQVLRKLEKEDKVAHVSTGDKWRLKDRATL